jgi:hypothetical protein
MGALVQRIIKELNDANRVEDFGDCVWMASDLIRRASSPDYQSGFDAIDREDVSEAEGKEIQYALLDALPRNANPRWVRAILSALSSGQDPSLKQLWLDYLAKYLEGLMAANGVVHTALSALHDLGEPVFERNFSGNSLVEVERNIERAHRYLHERGITIPW